MKGVLNGFGEYTIHLLITMYLQGLRAFCLKPRLLVLYGHPDFYPHVFKYFSLFILKTTIEIGCYFFSNVNPIVFI